MIVIKGDAAQKLKRLLEDYRKADENLYESLGPDSDMKTIHQSVKAFREAEMRIAILIDVFSEDIPETETGSMS